MWRDETHLPRVITLTFRCVDVQFSPGAKWFLGQASHFRQLCGESHQCLVKVPVVRACVCMCISECVCMYVCVPNARV